MIGRMRGVRPTYFQNGELYDLEEATKLPIRVALKGLECWTDRAGRFEWNPRTLKLNILPYDPIDFSLVLDALERGNFIARYEVGGRFYGAMNPEVWKQQNINKNEAQSEIPEPPAGIIDLFEQRALSQGFHSYRDDVPLTGKDGIESALTEANIRADSESLEVKGSEGKGNEVKEDQQQAAAIGTLEEGQALADRQIEDISSTVQQAISDTNGTASRGALSLVAPLGDRRSGGRLAKLPAIVGKRTYTAITQRLAIVSAEMQEGTRQRLLADDLRVLQAEIVFSYWIAKTGHDPDRTIFDDDRERRIVKQLKMTDGDVSELLYAIDGSFRDKHLQGDNDRSRKYDGIETIFRDRAIVERLARSMPGYRNKVTHPIVEKYAQAVTGVSA